LPKWLVTDAGRPHGFFSRSAYIPGKGLSYLPSILHPPDRFRVEYGSGGVIVAGTVEGTIVPEPRVSTGNRELDKILDGGAGSWPIGPT
jgi:hypothetical protein